MKTLPRKSHRIRRSLLACLFVLGITILAVGQPPPPPPPPVGWQVEVEQGQKTDATLGITNRCLEPHRFRVIEDIKYLAFQEPTDSMLIAPGARKPLAALFDSIGLKDQVYKDKLTVQCLDCKKEKASKCTQDRDEIPVQLTVKLPVTLPAENRSQLNCCQCLGASNALDLSTGTASWMVNGSPAVLATPNGGWNISTSGAKWVSTTAGGGTAFLPGGAYNYTLTFQIPACIINQTVTLFGTYGADNEAAVFLDSQLLSKCTSSPNMTAQCFTTSSVRPPFNNVAVSTGIHTLTVKVQNQPGSPTGMFINARIVGLRPAKNLDLSGSG